MKTYHRPSQSNRSRGSVLVVALSILAVASIALGSYLVLVQTQTNSVARSQCWNSALAVVEAGLEDGLAEINRNSPVVGTNVSTIVPNPWSWTNSATADGWSPIANGQTSRTNYISGSLAGSNFYVTTIYLTNGTNPIIVSAGAVAFTATLWGSRASPQPFVATAGTAAAATNYIIGRRVLVQTGLVPLFSVGVLAMSNINMNGNNVTIDSFDSTNPHYSTNGQWTNTLRRANGSIATDSSVVGDISIGNGNIYGHVYTGPGSSENAVQVGSQGAVGDLAWQTNGNSGIESNYWSGNFNTAIPDVQPPTGGTTSLPQVQTNGALKGSIVLNGNYAVTANNAPTAPLVISGPTVLWVQGSFTPPNLTFTNGGSLTLYIGTTNTSGNDSLGLGGNGSVNSPGYAVNLTILGLPSLTSISLNGNAALIASIYAPEANFSGGGGGNNNNDTSGAMIVKSVSLNGHWNFHYDESLAFYGPSRGWIASHWTEIKY